MTVLARFICKKNLNDGVLFWFFTTKKTEVFTKLSFYPDWPPAMEGAFPRGFR